jgi:hypothetical protein
MLQRPIETALRSSRYEQVAGISLNQLQNGWNLRISAIEKAWNY